MRNLFGYLSAWASGLGCRPNDEELRLNAELSGYPRNHNYRLCGRRTIPSFRLYDRVRRVAALLPEEMETFLDLGCCRGYFVIEAAGLASCRSAVGIDVHEPFVATASRVGQYLGVPNAAFHLADLDAVAESPERFGGPFDVVLTLGTYHYLYWGSEICPTALGDHREILRRLAGVCTERLIFSARLEVGRLPRHFRFEAAMSKNSGEYTTARFLEAAAEFFDVAPAGHLGKDPLLVMSRKIAQNSGSSRFPTLADGEDKA